MTLRVRRPVNGLVVRRGWSEAMSSQPWPKGDDWKVARYKPVASALADTAHVFDKNCEDLYTLTELPTALLAIGNTEVRRMAYSMSPWG